MDDSNTQRRSSHAGPLDAFHRALGSTMFACEHLGAAIRIRDAEAAERAAADAVESWLTMRRVLRKLELDAMEAGPRLQTAKATAGVCRRALGDLLDRAQVQLVAPSLHQLLAQLRLSLAIANGECGRPASNEHADDPAGDI